MLKLFEAARRVSVPILAISTADQAATEAAIFSANKGFPIVRWDSVTGLTGVGDPKGNKGTEALARAKVTSADTVGFAEAMLAVQMLPQTAIVIAHNVQRQIHSSEPSASAQAVQAIANVRDSFKRDFRMLVLLSPHFMTPSELEHDVVALRHELPTREALRTIVVDICESAKKSSKSFSMPTADDLDKATEAVSGLSEFAAEQQTSMSLTDTALDLDVLWERKRVTIEQTRGLKVYRGKEKFDDIVGLASVKARLRQRLSGRKPVGVVVWLDEIDKVLANVEHDTSGVRMDQLRTLLADMEDQEWEGVVLAGLPGGGKSLLGKAFGNEAGVPTISLDLAAMEGSLVGESEAKMRQAMAVIKAVGSGNAFFVATSNNATIMRPELQRRFTSGFFFFDLLTKAERDAAWKFYEKKYELAKQQRPDDDGWTAAEIRNCAREAWNCRMTLVDAAKFIVPVTRARADDFDKMRQYAHGRYLDASKDGVYHYEAEPMKRSVRAIALPADAIKAIAEMRES